MKTLRELLEGEIANRLKRSRARYKEDMRGASKKNSLEKFRHEIDAREDRKKRARGMRDELNMSKLMKALYGG